MAAYLAEWTALLLRWFHVVAGIAWIGESFYFVMLDRVLTPPKDPAAKARGVAGELWSVHGGGFYHAQKYTVAPPELPEHLHWSKWKSYASWLSGFALFTVLYLHEPNLYLIDPAIAKLEPLQADALALSFLGGGWLVYDTLCKYLWRNERILGLATALFVLAACYAATNIFAGRAAFLIVGAMLASIMSANVFFVIIPGQRKMVAKMMRGEAPDPLPGKLGRQRSVHNTYFTLPVVFTMISNHYAMTYSTPHAWAILALVMAGGALTRQFFVLWHSGSRSWALPVAAAVCIAACMAWLAPSTPQANIGSSVKFADLQSIITARCVPCHAAHPKLMASAPAGLALDDADAIVSNANRIAEQVVHLRAMPLGNLTHITEAERAAIGQWVAQGAAP